MKRLIALVLVLCTLLSITACSGNMDPTDPTDAPTEPAVTEPGDQEAEKLQVFDFQTYSSCIDGVMLVENSDGMLGMADASGKLLVDYKYNTAFLGDGGYVVFNNKYVYDKSGTLVFEDDKAEITHCGNGVLLITEHGEWENPCEECAPWTTKNTYKKLDGTVIYCVFGKGQCGQFNKQGYAWVEKIEHTCWPDGVLEIINLQGKVVRSYGQEEKVVADKSWIIGEDGLVLVDNIVEWGGTRFISIETVKDDVFDSIWQGESLLDWAMRNEYYPDDFLFHCAYDDNGYRCCSLNSLSVMKVEDRYFLFDIEAHKIVAEYCNVSISASKYILVQNSEGQWGYIDREGKEYAFYEDATYFDDGYAMVKMDGMLYVVDEDFNVVSEGIEGDSAFACFNKFFGVRRGDDIVTVKFNP